MKMAEYDKPAPKIIALNGWPKSGKSEVARILVEEYGAVIVDDAAPLRKAAPILFHGVELTDCYTQEGKEKLVTVNEEVFTVRQILGFLGDILEERFGEEYLPEQAMAAIEKMPYAPYYVLPSVRKGEGYYYRENANAVVWEIDRGPAPENPNEFDRWAYGAVSRIIPNFGTVADLEEAVRSAMFDEFYDGGMTRLSFTAPPEVTMVAS